MRADRTLWPDEFTVFNILYDKFLFWSIVVGLFTFAWLIIAVLRYREGIEPAGKEELKVGTFPKERHNFDLELAWFVGPTILVIWVTILAFGSMNIVWGEVQNLQNDEDSFTVEANGLQWYWDFYYVDELSWEDESNDYDVQWDANGLVITDNSGGNATKANVEYGWSNTRVTLDLANNTTLDQPKVDAIPQKVTLENATGDIIHTWQHIPAEDEITGNVYTMTMDFIIPCNTNVLFNIHSMNPERDANFDATNTYQGVQHALWLNEWGMKEDAVPGLDGGTWTYVQPNTPGEFPYRCAEYCGKEHSLMQGNVKVVVKEGESCDADFGVYFDHEELR